MTKEVKDQLVYDIALKFASGNTPSDFIASFKKIYEEVKLELYPKSDHKQGISY